MRSNPSSSKSDGTGAALSPGERRRLFSPDARALFVSRPNRFLVEADLGGRRVPVHCANPGRLAELLLPGAEIFLERAGRGRAGAGARKTEWSLAAVSSGKKIIPLISVRANLAAGELFLPLLFPATAVVESERSLPDFPGTRFDFLVTTETSAVPVEVKSCTLLGEGGRALFPDAPTLRGARHVRELTSLAGRRDGSGREYRPMLVIAVFHEDACSFSPNAGTDPGFAAALKEAAGSIDIRIPVFSAGRDGGVELVRKDIPLLFPDRAPG